MEESPLSPERLAKAASSVRAAWRLVASRAPAEVLTRVEAVLAAYENLEEGEASVTERLTVARKLEALDNELRGRTMGSGGFYEDERLGLVRRMEPVSIVETIDDERVQEHLDRYESRAQRAMDRLDWFLERAGVEKEEPGEVPAWEQPYAAFDDAKEHVLDD